MVKMDKHSYSNIIPYPNSVTLRLVSITFIVTVAFFIWLAFQDYLTGEIAIAMNLEGVAEENASTYQVLTDILFFLIASAFIYLGKLRLTSLGHLLMLFAVYITLQTVCTAEVKNNIYYINLSLAAVIWIIIYFSWFGVFNGVRDRDLALRKFTIICFIYCSALFLINYVVSTSIGLIGYHYIEVNFLLTLFPFITLLKNKRFMIILTISTAILILISAKRASSVAFVITLFFYMLFYGKSPVSKVRSVFIFSAISILSLLLIDAIFPDNFDYMLHRFTEIESDGGSGRDESYTSLAIGFFEQNPVKILFGGGFNYVKIAELNNGYSAHNDFLEVAYDYGLIGLFMYLGIYFNLINISRNKYLDRNKKIACKLSIIIFFILSMISHLVLYATTIIWLVALWAYLEVDIQKSKKNRLKGRHAAMVKPT